MLSFRDDDLTQFEAVDVPFPSPDEQVYVDHQGARIWCASFGSGFPIVLLHGGLGHSGNWGYQIQALTTVGYRAVVVDTRGHGRSTRDDRPYTYELLASDLAAVLEVLSLSKAALIGWSDGAFTALIAADLWPERVAGVFFFACNMDPSGVKEIELSPRLR